MQTHLLLLIILSLLSLRAAGSAIKRAGAPQGLVTWLEPFEEQAIGQCYPLDISYLSPIAPLRVELLYRYEGTTYLDAVREYDPKGDSGWEDSRSIMVVRVNQVDYRAGALIWFKTTDIQGIESYLQGTGYTVQPSDNDRCLSDDVAQGAETIALDVMTGQGIFTTFAAPSRTSTILATSSPPPSALSSLAPLSSDTAILTQTGTLAAAATGSSSSFIETKWRFPVAAVVVVVSIVVVLALLGVGGCLLWRRKKRRVAVMLESSEVFQPETSELPPPTAWTYQATSSASSVSVVAVPDSGYLQERDAGLQNDDDVERVPPQYSEATARAPSSLVGSTATAARSPKARRLELQSSSSSRP